MEGEYRKEIEDLKARNEELDMRALRQDRDLESLSKSNAALEEQRNGVQSVIKSREKEVLEEKLSLEATIQRLQEWLTQRVRLFGASAY